MVKGPAPLDQGLFLMHLHKGKEYFEQNELQKAREELEAAYNLRPQDEKVLNLLGMTYFKLEMLPQAEEMYVTLADNNPEIYTLQSNLGLIRLKLGKLEQAEESLRNALELQPTNPKAHFYLGLLYEKMEKWERALNHFEHAKADKMIGKMKEKVAEEAAQRAEEILPFVILEVFGADEVYAGTVEAGYLPDAVVAEKVALNRDAAGFVGGEDKAVVESEWIEHNISTGKMRRRDVIEALERLEQRESEPLAMIDEKTPVPQQQERQEDSDDIPVWQETEMDERPEGSTFPSQAQSFVDPDLLQAENEMGSLQPGNTEERSASFLLPEETAADISTFLAESRMEQHEEPESESFPAEPVEVSDYTVENSSGLISEDSHEPSFEEQAEEGLQEDSIFERDAEEPFEKQDQLPEEVDELQESPPDRMFEPERERPDETQMMSAINESVIDTAPQQIPGNEILAQMPPPEQPGPPSSIFSQQPKPQPDIPAYQPTNLDQFSRDRYYVQPLVGADRFLLIDPHLLEIVISEKLICRKGTISSFTGNLQFHNWTHETEPFIQVSGTGVIFLADRRQEVFLISLNNENIFVETNHLLVAQSAMNLEPYSFQQPGSEKQFSYIKISGRGTIALTCQTKPLTLNVYEAMPANIPAEAIIAWSGKVTPDIISDEELRSVMMAGQETVLLRFSGTGDVVVEQGSLWGDRRAKQ